VCLRLPAELERVDAWLDDERFFAPFVPFFDPRIGRPSVPMETYLRLMFLKFRYRLGYETLCAEVSDSISLSRRRRTGPTPRPARPARPAPSGAVTVAFPVTAVLVLATPFAPAAVTVIAVLLAALVAVTIVTSGQP
jgi:IS5 family transposase